MVDQFFEADEIGMMGVTVFLAASVPKPVPEVGNEIGQFHLHHRHTLFCQIPVRAVGLVVIIEIDALRTVDLKT